MRMLMPGNESTSVGGQLIDVFLIGPLHGTLYPMMDLYYTRYD